MLSPVPRRTVPGLLAVALVVSACSSGGSRHLTAKNPARKAATTTTGRTHGPVSLEVTPAAFSLPGPVSREVVVADGSSLLVLGGLDRHRTSTSGVFRLDPSTGRVTQVGSLAAPVHDAAGARIGGTTYVLGGGDRTTVAAIQSYAPGATSRVAGRLPAPRSDLVTATDGGTVYVVGGYDGKTPAADVLATTDGTTTKVVARLRDAVRYPAAVVAAHTLYVFGGETASGHAIDTVQAVDVRSGAVSAAATLPYAVAHAVAFELGGRIFVAGGRHGTTQTDRVLEFDPARRSFRDAGRLPSPTSDGAVAVVGGTAWMVGGEHGDVPITSVVRFTLSGPASSAGDASASAFAGRMLIADRGNDRLIVVDAGKRVLWTYPSPTAPPPPGGFYFPDDGFFTGGGTGIISNEEGNNTIVEIGYPSGRVQWTYGHPHQAGSAAGFLNQPDDAFLLKDGNVIVADAKNCRILWIRPNGTPDHQLGTTGRCVHDPPRSIGYPNGDTPLADGNILVSEINGSWIDEITPDGKLVWKVHLPIAYPSDPQQLGPDLYLVADYARPGGIIEFTREGRIVWSYRPTSGEGMLDHPSLAERLPNGLIGVNDDYRHRVALIDPSSDAIVWQYGQTDAPGTGPDQVRTPDGFDLLLDDGSTPLHPMTG